MAITRNCLSNVIIENGSGNRPRLDCSSFQHCFFYAFMGTLAILVFFHPIQVLGQVGNTKSVVYSILDSVIGEPDMELYNGPIFKEDVLVDDASHSYFLNSGFVVGDLSYKSQQYFDQKLKYNIHLDELLVTPKFSQSALLVQLEKSHVEEFTIQGNKFINVNHIIDSRPNLGYMQVLGEFNGNLLLKKHIKKRVQSKNRERVTIQYQNEEKYFIIIDNQIFNVNSKSRWKSLFKDQKAKINRFYDRFKLNYKTDKDRFFMNLFDELLTEGI